MHVRRVSSAKHTHVCTYVYVCVRMCKNVKHVCVRVCTYAYVYVRMLRVTAPSCDIVRDKML